MRQTALFFLTALFAVVITSGCQRERPAPLPSAEVELRLRDYVGLSSDLPVRSLEIVFRLPEKWHVYWKEPGETGLPTEAQLLVHTQAGEYPLTVRFPTPELIEYADILSFAFEDEVSLLAALPPELSTASSVSLSGELSWLICSEELCIPEERVFQQESVGFTAGVLREAERYYREPQVAAHGEFALCTKDSPAALHIALAPHQETWRGAQPFFYSTERKKLERPLFSDEAIILPFASGSFQSLEQFHAFLADTQWGIDLRQRLGAESVRIDRAHLRGGCESS